MIVSKESYFQQLKYTRNAILVLVACCFSFRECYTAEHEIVDSKQHRATPSKREQSLQCLSWPTKNQMLQHLLEHTNLPTALNDIIIKYIFHLSEERIKELRDMLSSGWPSRDQRYQPSNFSTLDPYDLISPFDDKNKLTGFALLCYRYFDKNACNYDARKNAILQKISEVVQKFPGAINEPMGDGKTPCSIIISCSIEHGLIRHDLFDIFNASACWKTADGLRALVSQYNLRFNSEKKAEAKDRALLTSMIKQYDLNSPKSTPLYNALTCGVSDEIIMLLIQHQTDFGRVLLDEHLIELAREHKRSEGLVELLGTHSKTISRVTIESALLQHTPLPSDLTTLIVQYLTWTETEKMRKDLYTTLSCRPTHLDPSMYTYPVEKMGITGLDMLWNNYLGCASSNNIHPIIITLVQRYPELISTTDQKYMSLSLCHQAVCSATYWNDRINKHTIRHGLLDVLRENNSIDWSTRDIDGQTCLISLMNRYKFAFNEDEHDKKKDKSFITFLVQKCDINSKDYKGDTALSHAIDRDADPEVVKFLVELKADPHILNGPSTRAQTALQLAMTRKRSPALIAFLKNNRLQVQGAN